MVVTKNVTVTILCTVYNHEKYLRQCLSALATQETNFVYEVIVHDDASTDGSVSIIEEYCTNYPNIFVSVLQKKNKYSHGRKIEKEFMLPIARGEYVAWCEGDDYWCDVNKLQEEFNALEEHSDCTMCASRVAVVSEDGMSETSTIPSTGMDTGIIYSCDFFESFVREKLRFQTSSFFFRMNTIRELYSDECGVMNIAPVGDVPMMLFAASKGNIYFIDKVLSCYRLGVSTGWTMSVTLDKQKRMNHMRRMLSMLDLLSTRVEDIYRDSFDLVKHSWELALCEVDINNKRSARKLLLKENRYYLNTISMKGRVFIILMAYAPWVARLYYRIRYFMNSAC